MDNVRKIDLLLCWVLSEIETGKAVFQRTAELLAFGQRIGLKASWSQRRGEPTEHFDLFDGKIEAARTAGAVEVTSRELIKQAVKPKRETQAAAQAAVGARTVTASS